jgi:hypothetical protein
MPEHKPLATPKVPWYSKLLAALNNAAGQWFGGR